MANVEPKVTDQIQQAAENAAGEIRKLQVQTHVQMLRNEFENPPAPVTAQGTLDHNFLDMIKKVVVWSDSEKTKPDLEKTLQLRALAYEGYERKKSGRPLSVEEPISDVEIAAEIRSRIERASRGPQIRDNRHIHS